MKKLTKLLILPAMIMFCGVLLTACNLFGGDKKTVPSTPRNFTATAGNEQVVLAWTAPTDNGGSTITKYEVSKNSGASYVESSAAKSHVFTGLTNETQYTFMVRAVNSKGAGEAATQTAAPSASAPVMTVPTAPQNLSANAGDRQVTILWTAPLSDGNSVITNYEVSSNNGNTWVTSSSNSSHTFTGLTNGNQYTFKVRAVNAIGNSPEATTTATPVAPQITQTVPTVPQNFNAVAGNTQVALTWTTSANNGNSTIIRYEVSSNNGGAWVTASSSTSHTFTGLTNGSQYTFKVRAVNAIGNSLEAMTTATPIAPQPTQTVPTVPQSFNADAGDTQVTLTWTAPANNGNSAITRYEVSVNNGIWNTVTSPHTVTGLTNGTQYAFKVRAVNAIGNSSEVTTSATPQGVIVQNGSEILSTNDTDVIINGTEISLNVRNSVISYSLIGKFVFSPNSTQSLYVNSSLVGNWMLNLNERVNTAQIYVTAGDLSSQHIYTFTIYRYPIVQVSFYNNGELLSSPSIEENQPLTPASSVTNVSREGYTLDGWYTNSSFIGQPIQFPYIVGKVEHTFYAKWNANTYTVTYDYQGATGGNSATTKTVTYGQSFNLAIPTKTNNTFGGWYTQSGGKGTQYTNASGVGQFNWTQTSGITLYAKWTAELILNFQGGTYASLEVSFNLNGASGTAPATQTITSTTGLAYPTVPTRGAHVFAGWYKTPACDGTPFDFSSNIESDLTLYAKWILLNSNANTARFYTLPQNGSSIEVFFSYAAGIGNHDQIGFVPLKSGVITFEVGTAMQGTFKLYNASYSLLTQTNFESYAINYINYNVTANAVYYITISRDSNGSANAFLSATATSGDNGKVVESASNISLPVTYGNEISGLPLAAKKGFYFEGWYTQPNGLGVKIEEGTTYDFSAATLYAKWKNLTISYLDVGNVTFSGVHGMVYPTTHTYGVMTYLVNPTKENHGFDGWYTNSSGTGEPVTIINSMAYTENFTLYAKWTQFAANIIYRDVGDIAFSGQHGAGYPVIHTYGTDTLLANPTKTDYFFGGWYTDSSASGTVISSLSAANTSSTITIYAKWLTLTEVFDFTLIDSDMAYSITVTTGARVLDEILIPNSYGGKPVTKIGDYAFVYCSNITSIIIPNNITNIGNQAFEGCANLLSVTFGSGVTNIGDQAFSRCENLTNIIIPNSVTSIGSLAFSRCTSFTNVTIPDNVVEMGNGVFLRCTNLSTVVLGNGVTSINESTFYNCTNLISITIPSSVKQIVYNAFEGTGLLNNAPDNSIVYADKWVIGCKGTISSTVGLNAGTEGIANYTFYNCTALTSITIPNSVTNIGGYAFNNCPNLTIYTAVTSKPVNWDSNWNYSNRPVIWGCTMATADGQTYVVSFTKTATSITNPMATNGINVPYRTGYTFEGWSINSDCSTTDFTAANVYTALDDTTLYAIWTPIV